MWFAPMAILVRFSIGRSSVRQHHHQRHQHHHHHDKLCHFESLQSHEKLSMEFHSGCFEKKRKMKKRNKDGIFIFIKCFYMVSSGSQSHGGVATAVAMQYREYSVAIALRVCYCIFGEWAPVSAPCYFGLA